MAVSIYESYPPQISPEQEAYLVQTIKNWCIQHGLTVRPNFLSDEVNRNHVLATNAPVTLFPSPFPQACFDQAKDLQQVYNELYAAIASDEAWLEEIMRELIEVDDFLANLWKIHLAVKEEGYVQDISLGMFRSDYMLNSPEDSSTPSLKQVEFNTISSSFGGLSLLVARMHTELATFPSGNSIAYPPHALFDNTKDKPFITSGHPPPNTSVPTLATSLFAGHLAYGPSKTSHPLCILFLVQDNERNIFDQLALSTHLQTELGVPSFRLPVSRILTDTQIPSKESHPSRPLLYMPPSSPSTIFEVSVVYFRALYAPTEYDTPTSWAARHHLERSSAIKCPSILLHLSGSKKIQQVLTSKPPGPDHLSRFLPNASSSTIESLRSTFAPQYSLSPGSEGLSIALSAKSQNHVLKPQREGGGNNIYRDKITPFLKSIPDREYSQYILMELINPPEAAKNTVLRSDGEVVRGNVISELGIFGTCLWKNNQGSSKPEILHNTEGGYLMRTKGKESDEGGVAAGFSSLDSLILYEEANP